MILGEAPPKPLAKITEEVKLGYKHTKLGWIPEEWEVVRLEEICLNFKSGIGITSKDISNVGKYPVYGGNGLRGYTDMFTHEGDFFLIGRQGALCGNIVKISGKNFVSEHAIAVQADESNSTEFLAVKLDYVNLNRLSESSAQPGLSVDKLLRYRITIPPLPEQQKIAQILSTWDKAISKMEALIDQKKQLKKGLMQQLLTGKKRFKEFVKSDKMKETKLGMIPEDWEAPLFGEIFKMNSGSTPSRARPEYFKGNILWVTSGELDYNVIENTWEKISKEGARSSSLTIYPKDTFLIAITGLEAAGTRGRCAILGKGGTVNQSCMAFEKRDDVNTAYQFFFYRHFAEHITFTFAQGSKQQSLPKKILTKVTFIKPPIAEQRKMASVLSSANQEIISLGKQLDKLKEQKKGLMQKLLTGEVRVRVNEE